MKLLQVERLILVLWILVNMKIFVTEFEHKGKFYAGPNINAEDQEIAEQTAKASGYVVLG